jgi:hypothetical protein
LGASVCKRNRRGAPDFGTDPDASPAENAKVIIPVEKGVFLVDVQIAIERRKTHLINFHGFNDFLKLTAGILGAEDATRDLSDLPDRGLIIITLFFFSADQTGIRMF